MPKKTLFSHNQLVNALDYDETTGVFTWKKRMGSRSIIGAKAGHLNKQSGYVVIRLMGGIYQSHRLAWFYVKGIWPSKEIDHKNGNRQDNRFVNLREADSVENRSNRGINSNNTSGAKGVSLRKSSGKWCAQISHKGKVRHLGYFKDFDEAKIKYESMALELFGEFKRTTN